MQEKDEVTEEMRNFSHHGRRETTETHFLTYNEMLAASKSFDLIEAHKKYMKKSLSTKEKVRLFIIKGGHGKKIDLIQTLLAVAAAVIYVWQSYANNDEIPFWVIITETAFGVFFLADYVLHLYLAESKLRYIFSLYGMIDLLTIFPVIKTWVDYSGSETDAGHISFGFLRVVRLLRLLRVAKAYKLFRSMKWSETIKAANLLGVTVVSLLFCSAGFYQIVEGRNNITFFDAVYFVTVTLSTVGYGDIVPQKLVGKMVVILLILVSIILIPVQTRHLISLLAEEAENSYYQPQNPFVLVCGNVGCEEIVQFIEEFFSPVHEVTQHRNTSLVFLIPRPMDKELKHLLLQPEYNGRVEYLQGDFLNVEDMKRVGVQKVLACFILVGNHTAPEKTEREDKNVVLGSMVFKSLTDHTIPTHLQIHNISNKDLALASGADYVVCLHEIRDRLLGQACRCPGLPTLVINLVRASFAVPKLGTLCDDTDEFEALGITDGGLRMRRNKLICNDESETMDKWLAEFMYGQGQEICAMDAPTELVGLTFPEAATVLFMRFEMVALGVEKSMDGDNFLVMNPGCRYTIQPGDKLSVITFHSNIPELATGKYTDYSFLDAMRAAREQAPSDSPKHSNPLVPITSPIRRTSNIGRPVPSPPATPKSKMVQPTSSPDDDVPSGYNTERRQTYRNLGITLRRQSKISAATESDNITEPVEKDNAEDMKDHGCASEASEESQSGIHIPCLTDHPVIEPTLSFKRKNRTLNAFSNPWKRTARELDLPSLTQDASVLLGQLAEDLSSRREEDIPPPLVSPNSPKRVTSTSLRKDKEEREREREREREAINSPPSVTFSIGITVDESVGEISLAAALSVTAVTVAHDTCALLSDGSPSATSSMRNDPSLPLLSKRTASFEHGLLPTGISPRNSSRGSCCSSEQSSGMTTPNFGPDIIINGAPALPEYEFPRAEAVVEQRTDYSPSASALGGFDNRRQSLHRFAAKARLVKAVLAGRQEKMTLSSRTILDTSVAGIDDHILVITNPAKQLYDFIAPLRLRQAQTEVQKIVILCQQTLPSAVWDPISYFPDVYFIQGNPKRSDALVRGGIQDAAHIVVFLQADHKEEPTPARYDGDAVFVLLKAMGCILQNELNNLPSPSITVELAFPMSIQFYQDVEVLRYRFSKAVDQNRFNLQRVREMISNRVPVKGGAHVGRGNFQTNVLFAAGTIFCPRLLAAMLPTSFYSPLVINIVEQFMNGSAFQRGSFLSMVSVNECAPELIGQKNGWAQLFWKFALEKDWIPIGLYRSPQPSSSNKLPYVFTNPKRSTVLNEGDRVYILT